MKKLTLCADDYGMHPQVSRAIVELIQQQRVQATSCLVTSDYWQESVHFVNDIRTQADIGLHLNFTEGSGLSNAFVNGLPGLGKMLALSHLRLLNTGHLVEEISAQFEAFTSATGFFPDFIDGHQHVHHLPQVRDALLKVISRYSLSERFWVRSAYPMVSATSDLKAQIIVGSGAKAFSRQLQSNSIHHNSSFAGVYSLTPNQPFRQYMRQWMHHLQHYGLVMCHPARAASPGQFDHSRTRLQEYNYLKSQEFIADCRENTIKLVRFSINHGSPAS
ncbi:hypothetical protein GZ77_15710 [Endozoicomonas montiporae]|uniref:Cellobiose phosphorylase n=2 Tax=Endozoicomonas montiporae TaxID=1027273 RepID=A0A081N5L5_9GAMM|nr:ChbG/HpnK family deacetylase [Endozoicomonas montiporae]AMO57365.1 hypothetical protein EZMO1_3374 [Endozoicomonas montiporae CL-33]KEQ13738.1 hypothetical protein GZ77_15710 [Endozoicomonas montiporae]